MSEQSAREPAEDIEAPRPGTIFGDGCSRWKKPAIIGGLVAGAPVMLLLLYCGRVRICHAPGRLDPFEALRRNKRLPLCGATVRADRTKLRQPVPLFRPTLDEWEMLRHEWRCSIVQVRAPAK